MVATNGIDDGSVVGVAADGGLGVTALVGRGVLVGVGVEGVLDLE